MRQSLHWRYEITALPDGGYKAKRVLVTDERPTYSARLEVPAGTNKGALIVLAQQLAGVVCRDKSYQAITEKGGDDGNQDG